LGQNRKAQLKLINKAGTGVCGGVGVVVGVVVLSVLSVYFVVVAAAAVVVVVFVIYYHCAVSEQLCFC
jgi:phage shock protein PspC (stress-responsive transcriptional regulator)